MHDLRPLLRKTLARFERCPKNVRVCWAPGEVLGDAHYLWWAACARANKKRPVHVIAFSKQLQRAPRYVLDYLMTHEVLHLVVPACGRCLHPRAFRIAEQAHPDYVRANRWLRAHA